LSWSQGGLSKRYNPAFGSISLSDSSIGNGAWNNTEDLLAIADGVLSMANFSSFNIRNGSFDDRLKITRKIRVPGLRELLVKVHRQEKVSLGST
jgi:hypothetical protein